MWLATTRGFYSTVQHFEHPDTMVVRARARADLDNLVALAEALCQPVGPIVETPHADYPYRLMVYRHVWQVLLVSLADEVTYGNFKDAVAETNVERAHTYHDVWRALIGIEREPIQRRKRARRR